MELPQEIRDTYLGRLFQFIRDNATAIDTEARASLETDVEIPEVKTFDNYLASLERELTMEAQKRGLPVNSGTAFIRDYWARFYYHTLPNLMETESEKRTNDSYSGARE
ncbi:MAG TPA: hypothetical protein VJB66_02015 [Candidatus Nanoarchaeia archaeon]|nr:hypothetical protein [Candidatus Nanoarchaeia archaeon]